MACVESFTPALQRFAIDSALAAGFELAGVCPADGKQFAELGFFESWLAQGFAGEMKYLHSRNAEGDLERSALKNALPWANSVIVCALNYNTPAPYSTQATAAGKGWISRYAWGADNAGGQSAPSDYHRVVMDLLLRVEDDLKKKVCTGFFETRCYVDTGPVVERVYAKYAGLGWIGKNTCLINQVMGSWLFLGVIVTSLAVPDSLAFSMEAPDRCGSCTRCIDACPTSALIAPYQMDASRCISYLTIEKRGAIPVELRPGMGRHIFGCA